MYVMKLEKFKEIEHTADVGIQVTGSTLPETFANSAFGMYHILCGKATVEGNLRNYISLRADILSDLLVSWLGEINYLLSINKFKAEKIKNLDIKKRYEQFILEAELVGNEIENYKEFVKAEIKAVTYHQFEIKEIEEGYFAQVIFDI